MSLESYKDLILYRVDVWWKRDLENTDRNVLERSRTTLHEVVSRH